MLSRMALLFGAAGCRLAGSGSSVPEAVLTNADLEKLVDTNDEWIAARTGIRCGFPDMPSGGCSRADASACMHRHEKLTGRPVTVLCTFGYYAVVAKSLASL